MQRYNTASSSPASRKPTHIADYAAFDEESLMRHFMDETGKSREQMTQVLMEQWGGIKNFMDYCKQEKDEHDKSMRGEGSVPMLRLGVSPRHPVPVSID
jgi:hypothetical protein